MKILLLDNNDSFTFNIVDYLRRIKNIKFDVINSESCSLSKVNDYDKIIISPGPGLPDDFPFIFNLLAKYYTDKHILGICLGHQAIGQFFNADLININPVMHGRDVKIKVVDSSPLYNNLPEKFRVGLYHSWALDSANFPEKIAISSVSENGIIMGIKVKQYNIFGVQFHPESYVTEFGFQIIKNFIEL